jgi:glycosyltransferase involved in cell wall biosynthesis
MPTYNRAYILKDAIDSVVGQTFDDWELIIMDDGSTDNTHELVKSIGDKRIVYEYQENSGPSTARNNAVGLAGGEWVAYLDSDNELLPTYLETMLKYFSAQTSF